jgi:tryptophan halogenase
MIRRVVVAGTGSVAWITAAGLKRAFRAHALDVCVVDGGPEDSPVGWWTLPSQRGIHSLLGINEAHFMQHTGSTFKLATEHRGWQGDGSAFVHAHGEIGKDFDGTPFYKYLQYEASAGRRANATDFSVAGAAAMLARFARPMGTDLTASFTYGFHVEEQRYASYLRAQAERLGVQAGGAKLSDVLVAEDGSVRGLRLEDGNVVEADLFVDCTGPAARLMERVSSGHRDDWSAWLPCDRMLSALGPASRDFPALTQTVAHEAGWSWRAPLAESSMAGFVYGSAHLSDEAALATFRAIEPALRDVPRLTRFSPGRRREFWVKNCIALGAAGLQLEPLAGAGLHFAQLGLATLVELFPRHRASAVEAVEYNRHMGEHGDALRDFTIAHYRGGRARQGGLWAAARAAAPPTRLAHKLDLYAANGRITLLDHETFEESDWAWLLIGSGCVPQALELQARDRLAKLSTREVDAMRTRVQQLAASMPSHAEFVRRQAAPAARTQ